jgi:osmoprotectant transport system substrate-binding protein
MGVGGKRRREFLRETGAVVGTVALAGCIDANRRNDVSETLEIGVGSLRLSEQLLLGEMFYAVLDQKTTHTLFDELDYGNNAEVFEGFTKQRAYEGRRDLRQTQQRVFHVYPDYTGTLWQANPPFNTETKPTPQAQYEAVKEQMEAEYDLEILEMTPFENSFELAIRPPVAERTGIKTISHLAGYINDGNYDITVAMQNDFYNRTDGWPRLKQHYEFKERQVNQWVNQEDGIVRTPFGAESAYLKQGSVDIGLVYTTDPEVDDYGLTLLEDDSSFWPYYNIVPVVAREVGTEEVKAQLNAVIGTLDDVETMRGLNRRVVVNSESPEVVAQSFLRERGVL